jgi:hypothetical protein
VWHMPHSVPHTRQDRLAGIMQAAAVLGPPTCATTASSTTLAACVFPLSRRGIKSAPRSATAELILPTTKGEGATSGGVA